MSQGAVLPALLDRRNWVSLGGPAVIVMVLAMMVLPLPSGGVKDGPRLVAFDKRSGRALAWTALPARAIGTPMTYMIAGRQYIALTVHGEPPELVAFALPR